MVPVNIKVLGISGTPVKGGNCDIMVQEALKSAAELGGVETEFITLADKSIALCQHCQWCIENRAPCKIKDDAHPIFDKMIESDGWILGAPTWNATLAPLLLILFSRWRYWHFFTDKMRNKVVGYLTVGFLGMGNERALDVMGVGGPMIVVAKGWAIASTAAFGQRPAYLEHGVLDDKGGMRRVREVGVRVVEIAKMIKYATQAGIVLPKEYMATSIGARSQLRPTKKVFVEGVWREAKEGE